MILFDCPHCDGSGVIITDTCNASRCDSDGDCTGCPDRYEAETCDWCDGTGEIDQEQYETLTAE